MDKLKHFTDKTCKGCKFCVIVEDNGEIKYYCDLDNEEITESEK